MRSGVKKEQSSQKDTWLEKPEVEFSSTNIGKAMEKQGMRWATRCFELTDLGTPVIKIAWLCGQLDMSSVQRRGLTW